MLSVIKSVGIMGLDGYIVEVEVDVSNGLPSFDIVGLAGTSVKESRERVRAAVKNSGYEFPLGRITVNLAPADTRKEGPVFDLAIAVGVLASSGQLTKETYTKYVLLGELSLDGSLRGVSGVLPSVLVASAKSRQAGIVVPTENGDEAALVKEALVYPAENLRQVVEFLKGNEIIREHHVDIEAIFNVDNSPLIFL